MKTVKIPFHDLSRQNEELKDEMDMAIKSVIKQNAFSGGEFVTNFEKKFADYCNTSFSVGLNSGTSSLHMAMKVLDIGPGDEVIVPANSFIATAWGVSHAGGTPVFADCDQKTWQIDPHDIQKRITKKQE